MWACLLTAVTQLGYTELPEQAPDMMQPESIDDELLQKLHHVLLEVR